MIRFSTEKDREGMLQLWRESFDFSYKKYKKRFLDGIGKGCYLIYTDVNGMILGCTGITCTQNSPAEYKIDWTCVLKEFRGMGIMRELFKRVLLLAGDCSVMCNAWRLSGNETANLHKILVENGFQLSLPKRITWVKGVTCVTDGYRRGCVFDSGNYCRCHQDIYMRPSIENSKLRIADCDDKNVFDLNLRVIGYKNRKVLLVFNTSEGFYSSLSLTVEPDFVILKGITDTNIRYLEPVLITLSSVVTCDIYVEINSELRMYVPTGLLDMFVPEHKKYDSSCFCKKKCQMPALGCKCSYDLYKLVVFGDA